MPGIADVAAQSLISEIGVDMARCGALFTYAPDQVTVLKRVADKLLMYRTDGVAAPEVAEFER